MNIHLRFATRKMLTIWIFLLMAMNAVNWQDGGTNAASRFAAIQSMSERHTFEIGPFKDWTLDWAQTPDGRVFSNKAPGPMFLALPVAWVLNRAKSVLWGEKVQFHYADGEVLLTEPGLGYMTLISWLFQLLPFCFLVFLSIVQLEKKKVSFAGLTFAAVALLFGTTLSFYLNIYFGHAVSAWALLATFLSLREKKIAWAGFFFGVSALSDYGTVFVALPLAISIFFFTPQSKIRSWSQLAFGALVPIGFWVGYHTACFGNPWSLPMQFQNPHFLDAAISRPPLWGIANPFPDGWIILQLMFGPRRGILFTQPWMLVFIAALLSKSRFSADEKGLLVFTLGGLAGLLWMNAGFGAWHSGAAPGPRYLSIIFPCVAVLVGIFYDRLSILSHKLLWVGLVYSVLFRIVGYSSSPLADEHLPLWGYFWNSFFNEGHLIARLLTFVAVFGLFCYGSLKVFRLKGSL